MAIVSPSILSADFGKLGADCRMVLDAGAQMLHYDVMDGHIVPNISFGVPVLKSLHKNLPDAFYPSGPSCENAIQKSPQAFLNCKYKNFLPYFIAKANAVAIFNR